jgi:Na+/H+ antiporter NhaD/arsenite permease-like protein
MKTPIIRAVFYFCLMLGLSHLLHASTDLFYAEVEIENESAEARQASIANAFHKVLIKLTGNSKVGDQAGVARLLKQSLLVLALVLAGFVLAHPLHLEPATIAMFGAALLLLLSNIHNNAEEQTENVHHTFGKVEWVTIFFFVGLFIAVKGIEEAGVLEILAGKAINLTGGDMLLTSMTVLWVSAIVSAIVDNIPFVATMIPLIKSMAPTFGGAENLMPLWWSLALGACLGGNGSLVGASANLIVAGFAERSGHRIRFLPFMAIAFPLMLLSILISSVYIYLRYL